MTNAINSDVFATVKSLEGAITALREVAKDSGAEANGKKLDAYSEIIASISGIKLVKGNLPRAIGNQLREGLLEAGLKEALVKRYTENSVGALRISPRKPPLIWSRKSLRPKTSPAKTNWQSASAARLKRTRSPDWLKPWWASSPRARIRMATVSKGSSSPATSNRLTGTASKTLCAS